VNFRFETEEISGLQVSEFMRTHVAPDLQNSSLGQPENQTRSDYATAIVFVKSHPLEKNDAEQKVMPWSTITECSGRDMPYPVHHLIPKRQTENAEWQGNIFQKTRQAPLAPESEPRSQKIERNLPGNNVDEIVWWREMGAPSSFGRRKPPNTNEQKRPTP